MSSSFFLVTLNICFLDRVDTSVRCTRSKRYSGLNGVKRERENGTHTELNE
ncbi:hypothetical protein X777_14344 [Ooceraea biroi]|uniref:Uncharacterized protein n=1 Tax=Ooceraea biroi TaxID=2015173 RepID=A0A026WUT2_OOCBI|nr:hypothetical protein X777_14344 [Ooceraea biroi]